MAETNEFATFVGAPTGGLVVGMIAWYAFKSVVMAPALGELVGPGVTREVYAWTAASGQRYSCFDGSAIVRSVH